jgi:hypothetical protein
MPAPLLAEKCHITWLELSVVDVDLDGNGVVDLVELL